MKGQSFIAQRIKELRKRNNITQKELAEKTGISLSSIINYENGMREPNSKAMAALESYFHVTGEYLRGETDNADSIFIWDNSEIMDSVKESFPTLISKLLASFKTGSALEQKMLFDILVELCHVANIQKENSSFRSAAFQLMQDSFVHTTRFIDFCRQFPTSSDLEVKRLEKFKSSCIENFEKALSEFQNSISE